MKPIKILSILLCIVAMASCKDDKTDYNTKSGVVVSMQDAYLEFKESAGFVSIPVVLSGSTEDRNGYVTVTCEVDLYGDIAEEMAIDDYHYIITSQTINISPEDNEGYFEVRLIDDRVVNPDRKFIITLTKAYGAEIGEPKSTIVTLKDNDNDPYDRLAGTWKVNGSGADVVFVAYDEGETDNDGLPGYRAFYHVQKLIEIPDASVNATYEGPKATFKYDASTETGTITITYGQTVPSFTYGGFTFAETLFCYIDADYYIHDDGEVVFEWNEDVTELKVVRSPLLDENDQYYGNFDLLGYNADYGGWGWFSATDGVYFFGRK